MTNLKASFMESLICNVPQTARLLTCFEGDPPLPPSRIPVHETSDTASTSAAQFGPCPLPSVAAFITEVLSQVTFSLPPGMKTVASAATQNASVRHEASAILVVDLLHLGFVCGTCHLRAAITCMRQYKELATSFNLLLQVALKELGNHHKSA